MAKKSLSPGYIFFFILFWPDTWRILIGVLAAVLIAPQLLVATENVFAFAMLHVMIACIGYAATAGIAGVIVRFLKKIILGKRHS